MVKAVVDEDFKIIKLFFANGGDWNFYKRLLEKLGVQMIKKK